MKQKIILLALIMLLHPHAYTKKSQSLYDELVAIGEKTLKKSKDSKKRFEKKAKKAIKTVKNKMEPYLKITIPKNVKYNISPQKFSFDDGTITIQTYNILFPDAKVQTGQKNFVYRYGNIANQIITFKPTILGMQEVSPQTADVLRFLKQAPIDFFKNELAKHGYGTIEGEPACKKKSKVAGIVDIPYYFCLYNPIFYIKKEIEPLDSGTFWLNKEYKKWKKGTGAKHYRTCTWAKLKIKKSNKILWVFNTQSIQAANLESLHIVANKVAQMAKNEPAIIIGDFNCGTKKANKVLTEHIPLATSIRTLSPETLGPKGTSIGKDLNEKKDGSQLDHIFINNPNKFTVKGLGIIKRKDNAPMSDHRPMIASVKLN